ncbi:hypothetical protein ACWDTG_23685 [Rhodococcus zopfii]
MEHADIDPKDNPEYLTLSQAGKECGVSVTVLRELIQECKLVAGIARTKNGHAYLHRDHVPSWSQIEAILAQMYLQQLARVEKAMKNLEVEVEAVRFDLSEVHADPDGPLGDDLRAAADLLVRRERQDGVGGDEQAQPRGDGADFGEESPRRRAQRRVTVAGLAVAAEGHVIDAGESHI